MLEPRSQSQDDRLQVYSECYCLVDDLDTRVEEVCSLWLAQE